MYLLNVQKAAKPCAKPLIKNKRIPGIKKLENGDCCNISIGIPNLEPSGYNIISKPEGIAYIATKDCKYPKICDVLTKAIIKSIKDKKTLV